MALRLGDETPDFFAESTAGPIHFHQWLGSSWGLFFSHPADYTPVCTTEMGVAAKMKPLFEQRNVKLIALSVDPLKSHMGWIYDINETQHTAVNFPIIADPDRRVSLLYDLIQTYPITTGRNFVELLRVVDALQLAEEFRVVTPANWRDGDECLIAPAVQDEEVPKLFPKGARQIKPYLRYTPQPDL
jgi:alkyl hydroperoxide reductase subunit AhpC